MAKKRLCALLLLLAMSVAIIPSAATAVESYDGAAEYEGFLFELADGVGLPTDAGGIEHLYENVYRAETEEVIYRYVSRDDLLYVEPDWVIELEPIDQATLAASQLYVNQWNYTEIGGPVALEAGVTGEGVTVAIIDSGIDADHDDLKGARILTGKNYIDGTTDTTDNYNHGTPIAGIIAAQINGIGIDGLAPDVTLVPLKVYDSRKGSTGLASKAIRDAVDIYGADVINMSFSYPVQGGNSQSLNNAIIHAAENNAILVAASGNNLEKDHGLQYPAYYDEVIGVGGVSYSAGEMTVATNSTQNESVFVTAPGWGVSTLSAGGDVGSFSGTSFATPHVTALAALARSVDKDMTADEFRQMLIDTVDDAGGTGYDTSYGYGIINVESFIKALTGYEPEPEPDPEPEPWVYDGPIDENWFYDATDHWANAEIVLLAQMGLMNGTDTHYFSPEETMTRAMFVTILGRYYEMTNETTIAAADIQFTDVEPDSYYAAYAAWGAANGIIEGYDAETFGPDDQVTREQIAVLLMRYAEFAGETIDGGLGLLSAYDDVAQVQAWSRDAMAWAVKGGLITGVTTTELVPWGEATRAQCATILARYMALID